MRKLILSAALLSGLALAPLWSMVYMYWPLSGDLFFYAQALHLFSEQLWSGDLYPRWLNAANNGASSPMFIFYPPLAFYIGSIFQPLAGFDPHGIGRLILTTHLFHIISAILCFRWLQSHMQDGKATTAALFYALFPYTLIQFYHAYQFAIIAALAWLPLCFFAIDRRNYVLFALGLALLLLSHLLSFFILLPVIGLYILFSAGFRFAGFICAAFLSLGLTAFYWYPALLNRASLNMEAFTGGSLDWRTNFYHPYFLQQGTVFILLPLLAALLDTKFSRREWLANRQTKCWLAVFIYGAFMASPLSRPLWEAIPAMANFQFPFRFLIACVPATVMLCAILLEDKKLKTFLYALIIFAAVAGWGLTSGHFNTTHPYPELWATHSLANDKSAVGAEYITQISLKTFAGGELAGQISLGSALLAVLWGIYRFYIYRKTSHDQKIR